VVNDSEEQEVICLDTDKECLEAQAKKLEEENLD
jgi:hypothetical protein